MESAKQIIISGIPGSGKTTLCQHIIQLGNQTGKEFKGLISPAVLIENVKIGIDVIDLSNGKRFRLADLSKNAPSELMTKRWAFNKEAVVRGNDILIRSVPCDYLMIDELGPLEFKRNEGWINGLTAVDQGEYLSAIVVIRPGLLTFAQKRWENPLIINIHKPDQASAIAEKIIELLD